MTLKMEPEPAPGSQGEQAETQWAAGRGRAPGTAGKAGCQGWGSGKGRAPELGDFLVTWVSVFILFDPLLLWSHQPPSQIQAERVPLP